jgi:predicted alpha/beta-hydrolase family hydrolase
VTAVSVPLPSGEVSVTATFEEPDRVHAVAAVAHGAGAGMDHPFLVGFAAALRDAGCATVRFSFPYSEAGRRMPGPPAHATATWQAVSAAVQQRYPGVPIVATGKSYGGRMASMAAAQGLIDPAALVYLGYPLHPPGRPEKLRAEHLPDVTAPQLFLSGTSDPFVQPVEMLDAAVARCRDAQVHWIEGAGHSFEVTGARRSPFEVGAWVADPVVSWIAKRWGG